MIDAKDPGTVQMPLTVKRGRGRPRKADAMTSAQRAARYRARRVAVPVDLLGVSVDQFEDLRKERDELVEQVAHLRSLNAALEACVDRRDVTEKKALASAAESMRRFSRDPSAIVKPGTLQQWARLLERCAR